MKKTISVYALAAPLFLAGAGAFAQGHAGHAGHEGMAMKETAEQTKALAKEKKDKAEKAALRKVAAEEVGAEAVCPVTGEKFKVTKKTISASYKGKAYYFCCPGCKKPFIANPEKYLNKKETETEAVCPVTGEKFKVTDVTASVSYKGKGYYFCCPHCKGLFTADPEKYLNKEQPPLDKTYVCPMGCAQSDKPGRCPKCGMNMVEKK